MPERYRQLGILELNKGHYAIIITLLKESIEERSYSPASSSDYQNSVVYVSFDDFLFVENEHFTIYVPLNALKNFPVHLHVFLVENPWSSAKYLITYYLTESCVAEAKGFTKAILRLTSTETKTTQ